MSLVNYDVADGVFGHRDVEVHDRFEQDRAGRCRGLLESERAGDLEGSLRRIDRVM